MCGILGFNWKDEKLIKRLGKLLQHRGPDKSGIYIDKKVSLGHTRLSILDLSAKGNQPMQNKEKTVHIVYNGEVFNFNEIKSDLIKKGYKFFSKTDTEVILNAYSEYGFECIKKFNGQFALCIYDKNKKILFLARDRVGILPLYYYFDNKMFIFSSELKVILKSGVKKKINELALNYYVAYGHTPHHQSIIENAYKLEPAHYLVFDLKNNKISKYKKYWNTELTGNIKKQSIAKRLILKKIEESVKKRLVADVPVGAFLSGGLDSSAIVAFAAKYKRELNTFSIKFDYGDYDESKYANIISKKFKTKHHVIEFTAKDVKELASKLAYHYDEPFGDPSMIPTYLVSKVARQYVTVALSGDGGDELFGGYDSYKDNALIKIQDYYPKYINKIMYGLLKKINLEILKKPIAFFEIGTLKKDMKFARIMSYLDDEEYKNITGKNPIKIYEEYARFYAEKPNINAVINTDLNLYLPDCILTKVDRASMANSLESRPPLLDHEIIELACSIDPKFKLNGKEGKWILKKALEGILPKKIIYRKKKGFGVPLKYYLKNELKELITEKVIKFKAHNYFNTNYIKEIMGKKEWGKDYSRVIWSLLMFNLWWEKWMK